MRKVILTTVAIFLFGYANAQQARYGIKGAVNISNFFGDTEGLDLKSRVGFDIGGFVEIKYSGNLSLQPEILYATKGATFENIKGTVDGNVFSGSIDFNLAYVVVPLMFKYYVVKSFSIEAGPQMGFLTSAKNVTKLDGFSQSVEMDSKDLFKSIDFALNFGAGYNVTKNIYAGARYSLGIENIAKNEFGNGAKLYNSGFSFSVGYNF